MVGHSNLPPGVSEGSIPGNTDMDAALDKLCDAVSNTEEVALLLAFLPVLRWATHAMRKQDQVELRMEAERAKDEATRDLDTERFPRLAYDVLDAHNGIGELCQYDLESDPMGVMLQGRAAADELRRLRQLCRGE